MDSAAPCNPLCVEPGTSPQTHVDPGADGRLAPRRLHVLGVGISDLTMDRAVGLVETCLGDRGSRPCCVYFANAHTLNLAAADDAYRAVLNAADYVFGDGTGVRWAARLRGGRLSDNVNGTDLVPALLSRPAPRRRRLFLLGTDPASIERAARFAAHNFPGWAVVGYRHGFLGTPQLCQEAILHVNGARPDLLLVGMGNPLQERWVHDHREQLRVPVCMAVGGLFDFWAGNVRRAPVWLRRLGHEWLWRLCQQPAAKARRYLIGNPLFLARILRDAWAARGRWIAAS